MSDDTLPTSDYQSPLLTLTGATPLDHDGAEHLLDVHGVAWHYGDPLGEQRAIANTVVVDRSHRRVLAVTGDDAAEFLNNLLTQKLDDAADGFSASAFDLDIKGHILHHADISRVGDTFYLDVSSSQLATFQDFLQKMIFWSAVEIEEADLGVLTVLGDAELPADLNPVVERSVPWRNTPRRDVLVPRGQLLEVVEKLGEAGIQPAGLMAFTAKRVRALEPELAVDLDHKSIPHELPLMINRGDRVTAVHLEKGCYRGQETVARVENLGRSPRVMVMLHLDGSAPVDPVPGDPIMAGGRNVGRLGTVVHDCDYGPIALGLVKRSAVDKAGLVVTAAEGERPEVAVNVDRDSIVAEESEKAGRAAIEKLRRGDKSPE